MKFVKKPIEIEATQWFKHGDHPAVRQTWYAEVADELGTSGCSREEPHWSWQAMGMIDTPEGKHAVIPGDWIITGIKGEHYPCKPDIFEATYDLVGQKVSFAPDREIAGFLNDCANRVISRGKQCDMAVVVCGTYGGEMHIECTQSALETIGLLEAGKTTMMNTIIQGRIDPETGDRL